MRWLICPLVLLGLTTLPVAQADDGTEDPRERARKIAAAKRKIAAAERELTKKVNKAIDRGADWLVEQQNSEGIWHDEQHPKSTQNLGRQAWCVYTLVKCLGPKHKAVQKGLAALEKMWVGKDNTLRFDFSSNDRYRKTYSIAAMVLMYDALDNPPGKAKPGKKKPQKKKRKKKKGKHTEHIGKLARWILSKQAEQVWRYPGAKSQPATQDLSNTQYALLALQAAARNGFEVPTDAYRKVITYLLEWQQPKGPLVQRWIENPAYEPGVEDRYGPFLAAGKVQARGWSYLPSATSAKTGSMTTAGVACLAIVKEHLMTKKLWVAPTRRQVDDALLSGLAWLDKHFTVKRNPGPQDGWHYYYLYGLERVAAFLGLKHVGKNYWYPAGAAYLVGEQTKAGCWPAKTAEESIVHNLEDHVMQTCFALLFLQRATVKPLVPLGPVITDDAGKPPAENK